MSKFQLILISIFIICILGGVFAFATFKGSNSKDESPSVSIWGSFPADKFNDFIQKINLELPKQLNIQYTEIPQSSFRQQFIEALASGRGPDAILVPQSDMYGFYDKIIQIPNTFIKQRDFQNTYISQAYLYLTSTGVTAIPFIIDPLVMYYNKTMLTNIGIAKHPQFWDEFSDLNKKITIKDTNSNIRRSAVALGEFANINNAREILSSLFLQANNPISYFSNENLQSSIGDGDFAGSKTSSPALSFFTQFADPRSSAYSWNRSLQSSKNSFLSGVLATYFGFTSEISDLRSKNPNLDFDIARLPQARNGSVRATYGNMYGISIVKSTFNVNSTFEIINTITQPRATEILSETTYLPSVRRDSIAKGSVDPYMSIFLDSALISRGWLDSNPSRSYQIFRDMVESVTSGRSDNYSALKQAGDELNLSLKNK